VVPQVVLAGLPNAGKSSLANAMVGTEVAIASPIPGTTRDFVRARLERTGLVLDILDTAGFEPGLRDQGAREASSPEGHAQAFTRSQLANADLVLYCSSLEWEGSPQDRHAWAQVQSEASGDVWWVRTKTDLDQLRTRENMPDEGLREFHVSSLGGTGVAELLDAIAQRLKEIREEAQDGVPLTSERCRDALVRAQAGVREAIDAAANGAGDEIVAGAIRWVLDELGQVAGTVVNNDVLDALFSRFCLGK
jgi:tRNA modification GTPase